MLNADQQPLRATYEGTCICTYSLYCLSSERQSSPRGLSWPLLDLNWPDDRPYNQQPYEINLMGGVGELSTYLAWAKKWIDHLASDGQPPPFTIDIV